MIRARQIVSAIVAAVVCFAGVVAAEPAHAHALGEHAADAAHMLAVDADIDHHAILDNDHHGTQPSDDDSSQLPAHSAVFHFHFHSLCFIAIIADAPVFGEISIKHIVIPPEAVASVLTRSTAPPDRPPRIFL